MKEYCIIPPFKVDIFTTDYGLLQSISLSFIPQGSRCKHYILSSVGEQVLFFFSNYLKKRQWHVLFNLPLYWDGLSSFTRQVLLALQKEVPFGSVVSYSDLAKIVGRPNSSRAVGRALGRNPWPVVIPCHRVIRKDGGLGGFSSGIEIKRFLLIHEGVLSH